MHSAWHVGGGRPGSAVLPQECLNKVRGGHLQSLCLSDHPWETSSHRAGEMGLQSDAPGCYREGGWRRGRLGLHLCKLHTQNKPRQKTLGISYHLHCRCPIYKAEGRQPLLHSHSACGDRPQQEMRGTPRNRASSSHRPGGCPGSSPAVPLLETP